MGLCWILVGFLLTPAVIVPLIASSATKSYLPIDLVFVFDTTHGAFLNDTKQFAIDSLAAAMIEPDYVRVALVTCDGSPSRCFLQYELTQNKGMGKLEGRILGLPGTPTDPIISWDDVRRNGRQNVRNVTVVFASDTDSHSLTAAEEANLAEVDNAMVIVAGWNNNVSASFSYTATRLDQFNQFSASLFFDTFSYVCSYNNEVTATTETPVEDLEEWIQATKEALIIDKSLLSSTIRTKTSAPDDRTSSSVIGYVGMLFVITVVVVPLAMDVPVFIKDVKLSLKYQRKYRLKMHELKASKPDSNKLHGGFHVF